MGVQIQSIKKCGFLRQIAEAAKRTTTTLREALLAAQGGHFVSTFSRGRLVVSQSGSGQSGSFEIGVAGKEWTQDNVFGLIEELLQMTELADPETYPDDADPAHTEALRAWLASEIMAGNVPTGIRQVGIDVTLVGLPEQGAAVGSF